MLATDILTQDHKEALGLISKLQGVNDGAGSGTETFNKMKAAVLLHLREEEEIYYPALAQHEKFSDLLDYSIPDHETVRQQLAQLSELEPDSPEFQQVLAEMKAAIEAHAENEEDEVFPQSIEVLGREKIEVLGDEIERMKGDSGMGKTARI